MNANIKLNITTCLRVNIFSSGLTKKLINVDTASINKKAQMK